MLVCPHEDKRGELVKAEYIVDIWKQAGVTPKPTTHTNSQPWRACEVIQQEGENCYHQ